MEFPSSLGSGFCLHGVAAFGFGGVQKWEGALSGILRPSEGKMKQPTDGLQWPNGLNTPAQTGVYTQYTQYSALLHN